MDIITNVLLIAHVCAGFIALGTGIAAAAVKIANLKHQWHVSSGRVFFWAMLVIFATAVPLSTITANLFLLLVAVFSFYLAWSGWSYAKNRSGRPTGLDKARAAAILLAALPMAYHGYQLMQNDGNGLTLVVFAALSIGLGLNDIRAMLTSITNPKDRIANHLTMMMSATIAAITAFLVVNIQTNPAYIVWLGPTVVIVPLITWMNIKVRRID